ncbi:MAG: hypothetical protein N4A59_16460 [Marinifilum sp.]|jgi:hypothetical protein|nr:hypothetical protein [Marinifilum sp.]
MKQTEKILGIIAIISTILSLFSIPFIGNILIISLSTLSFLYMYLGSILFKDIPFKLVIKQENFKEYDKIQKFGIYVMGMALSITTIGILFKFQCWPNSSLLLRIGLTGILASVIINLIKYNQIKSHNFSNILKRAAIIGVIGLFFMLTPRENILEIRHRNHPEYVEALKNAWADPDNQVLWDKVEEENLKILQKEIKSSNP